MYSFTQDFEPNGKLEKNYGGKKLRLSGLKTTKTMHE